MLKSSWPGNSIWPLWQKIFFCFFFIFTALCIAPWTWVEYLPFGEYIAKYFYQLTDWFVHLGNNYIFHVRKELVPLNGSGDTSYGWAQLWLYLCTGALVALIWSAVDGKRNNYNRLAFWFRNMLRYFVIINCFIYGIIKIFCLQMSFPSLSGLATPLGDYLPMRFSWAFIGYSTPYQTFSGIMELTAGLLLLFRRTTTLGILMATAVFINVMMLNLSYDIPVKIFSMQLVLYCVLLLAFEYRKLLAFFIQQKPIETVNYYAVNFSKKWQRITRVVVKLAFIILIGIVPVYDSWGRYQSVNGPVEKQAMTAGFYQVEKFVLNKDTIPLAYNHPLRWNDVVFEQQTYGSINTNDGIFMWRYNRAYFNYDADTVKKTMVFTKYNPNGNIDTIYQMHYQLPDSNTVILNGIIRTDSLYVLLKKQNRHFQLTERQFHWLSEYNR